MSAAFDRFAFARRFSKIRNGYPQAAWAKRFGLSYAAVRDMEQGRVNPSRATVLLINAIELSPGFMEDVLKRAKADLAALGTRGRCGQSGISTAGNTDFSADEPHAENPDSEVMQ